MFRAWKSLFQHQKQRVSSSSFRSFSSSSNTHLQSTIAWNIILVSAFLAHLIYDDKHSNSIIILSFLRVIAIIFQSALINQLQIQIIWYHQFYSLIHLIRSVLDEENVSNHIKSRFVFSTLIWIRDADLQIRWQSVKRWIICRWTMQDTIIKLQVNINVNNQVKLFKQIISLSSVKINDRHSNESVAFIFKRWHCHELFSD